MKVIRVVSILTLREQTQGSSDTFFFFKHFPPRCLWYVHDLCSECLGQTDCLVPLLGVNIDFSFSKVIQLFTQHSAKC